MKMNDNFDLIGLIISLLLSNRFSASVKSISDSCDLPLSQTRKFLSIIFENKNLLIHLSPTPESTENDFDPIKTATDFLDKIISGKADEEEIFLINMDDFIDDYFLLPITPIESGYANNVYPILTKNQHNRLFEIKENFYTISKNILDKQNRVQEAIDLKRKIEFKYKSPKNKLKKITCSPVSVIQNLTYYTLYIKDVHNNYYRMDRITSNIKILPDSSIIDQYCPIPYKKYFWGTESIVHEEPIHIKLRISPGTSNLIEKFKNDTALRYETSKLYQEGDYYYYEDDILGIHDFRRWLRSYGSSITVLEPQSLINEITKGVRKTLSYYQILDTLKI